MVIFVRLLFAISSFLEKLRDFNALRSRTIDDLFNPASEIGQFRVTVD
jgi:hypothetical protein